MITTLFIKTNVWLSARFSTNSIKFPCRLSTKKRPKNEINKTTINTILYHFSFLLSLESLIRKEITHFKQESDCFGYEFNVSHYIERSNHNKKKKHANGSNLNNSERKLAYDWSKHLMKCKWIERICRNMTVFFFSETKFV